MEAVDWMKLFWKGQPMAGTNTITRIHMTVAEVCTELGVARSTFYDWRAAHKAPPCLKLPNGDLRIKRTD